MIAKKFTIDQTNYIISIYLNNKTPLYKIGENFGCCDKTIKNLLIRKGIKIRSLSESLRKNKCDESFFDTIDTESKAYFLGLLYADGYNSGKHIIELALQKRDKYIIEKFKKAIKSTHKISFKKLSLINKNWQDSYRITISSAYMSKSLTKKGVMNKKSLILKFPTQDQVPLELMNHFIRGYIDGDGCISIFDKSDKYKNKITIRKYTSLGFVSSFDFCNGFCDFIRSQFNINCNVHKTKSKISAIHISNTKNIKILLNYIYSKSHIYMTRKYNKYIEFLKLSELSPIDRSYTIL